MSTACGATLASAVEVVHSLLAAGIEGGQLHSHELAVNRFRAPAVATSDTTYTHTPATRIVSRATNCQTAFRAAEKVADRLCARETVEIPIDSGGSTADGFITTISTSGLSESLWRRWLQSPQLQQSASKERPATNTNQAFASFPFACCRLLLPSLSLLLYVCRSIVCEVASALLSVLSVKFVCVCVSV